MEYTDITLEHDDLERMLSSQTLFVINFLDKAKFEMPFTITIVDEWDTLMHSQVIQDRIKSGELHDIPYNFYDVGNEGLLWPMDLLIRDQKSQIAYAHLEDVDARPEIRILRLINSSGELGPA